MTLSVQELVHVLRACFRGDYPWYADSSLSILPFVLTVITPVTEIYYLNMALALFNTGQYSTL